MNNKQEVLNELKDMSSDELKYTLAIYKIYTNNKYDLDTKIKKMKEVKVKGQSQ